MTSAPSDAGVVERVARAILAGHDWMAACETPDGNPAPRRFDDMSRDWQDAYRSMARAAIEAAYDLTPELLAVAWRAFRGDRKTLPIGPGPAFKEAFLAVHDAALRDGEG